MRRTRDSLGTLVLAALIAAPLTVLAQSLPGGATPHVSQGPKIGGSENMEIMSHVPLGGFFRVTDVEMEQEMSRPYVYVAQSRERAGFSIVDVSDPEHARVIYRWVIEDVDLHQGLGGMDAKYFKT
ncbi:MAG: hypothetical protein IIA44_06520, partial [Acidobacteria bacterium]|nr:hypothetical protein [Acidobacteriota bacterium]